MKPQQLYMTRVLTAGLWILTSFLLMSLTYCAVDYLDQ